jgi:hypothetical protein
MGCVAKLREVWHSRIRGPERLLIGLAEQISSNHPAATDDVEADR